MYVLAIANQKGGVAKTTSAVNLADAAARSGLGVLLVDLDPQGNASRLTDAQPDQAIGPLGTPQELTVSDALYATQGRPGQPVRHGLMHEVSVPSGPHWSDRLYVAPANQDLAARGADTWPRADRRLAASLTAADDQGPDLVLLDCPPTLGPLFRAALLAADGVLLVSEPADSAVEGLPRTMSALREVWSERNAETPALLGIVATNVPAREQRAGQLLEVMREEYGELLWEAIPRRAVVRQAEGAGAPISAYGREGRDVADAYERITARVLDHARLTGRTRVTEGVSR